MQVRKVNQVAPFYQIPRLQGRQIHQSDHLEIVHLSLEPGGSMEAHAMPVNVLFYILQGQGILDIDGVRHPLQINEFIEVPKAAMRYWSNESDSPLNLLVIKLISDQTQ